VGWFQRIRVRGACDASALHLGLIVKLELICLDGLAQLHLHGGTGVDGSLQGGREKAQGVAARRLGLIHGNIGLLQDVIDAFWWLPKTVIPMLAVKRYSRFSIE